MRMSSCASSPATARDTTGAAAYLYGDAGGVKEGLVEESDCVFCLGHVPKAHKAKQARTAIPARNARCSAGNGAKGLCLLLKTNVEARQSQSPQVTVTKAFTVSHLARITFASVTSPLSEKTFRKRSSVACFGSPLTQMRDELMAARAPPQAYQPTYEVQPAGFATQIDHLLLVIAALTILQTVRSS